MRLTGDLGLYSTSQTMIAWYALHSVLTQNVTSPICVIILVPVTPWSSMAGTSCRFVIPCLSRMMQTDAQESRKNLVSPLSLDRNDFEKSWAVTTFVIGHRRLPMRHSTCCVLEGFFFFIINTISYIVPTMAPVNHPVTATGKTTTLMCVQ